MPIPVGPSFDPWRKPCYLFALVAGDLACVSDEFVAGTPTPRPPYEAHYSPLHHTRLLFKAGDHAPRGSGWFGG